MHTPRHHIACLKPGPEPMIAPLKSLRQIGTATLCWLTLLLPGLTPAADIELPDIGL